MSGQIYPWMQPGQLAPQIRKLIIASDSQDLRNDVMKLRRAQQDELLASRPMGTVHEVTDQRFTSTVMLKTIHW